MKELQKKQPKFTIYNDQICSYFAVYLWCPSCKKRNFFLQDLLLKYVKKNCKTTEKEKMGKTMHYAFLYTIFFTGKKYDKIQ